MDVLASLFGAAAELVFVAIGVFARIGAALFLLPGFGERGVSMRVRLGGAVALTLLVWPIAAPLAGPAPRDGAALAWLVLSEAASGLVIGLAFRLLVFVLQIAGALAAQNLSVSQMFGAGVAPDPEPTIATMLAMGGIVLALTAGLHVELVAGFGALYAVLPFGVMPAGVALAEWSTAQMGAVFALGLSLALPFVAIGFAYNLALGALSRAMPQLLVALVGVPLLIGLGMIGLYLTIPELFARWSQALVQILADPLGGLPQ